MTTRQKFWLKVLLAVTLPLWIFPAAIVGLLFGCCCLVWALVNDLVDGGARLGDADDDGP